MRGLQRVCGSPDVQLCVISIIVERDPMSAHDTTNVEHVNDEEDWVKVCGTLKITGTDLHPPSET